MPPIVPPPQAALPGIAVVDPVLGAAQVLAVADVARLVAARLALVVQRAGLVDGVGGGAHRRGRVAPVAAHLHADGPALRVGLLAGREGPLQAVVVAHRCSALTPRYSSIAR